MIRIASCLSLLFCAAALGADLAESLKSGDFWKKDVNTTMEGVPVQRPDAEHMRARAGSVSFGSLTAGEVIFVMDGNTPKSLQAMIYNKGDDGTISAEDFNTQLEDAKAAIEELTGVRGKLRRAVKGDSAVKLKSWEWKWDTGVIRLEANASGNGSPEGLCPSGGFEGQRT